MKFGVILCRLATKDGESRLTEIVLAITLVLLLIIFGYYTFGDLPLREV